MVLPERRAMRVTTVPSTKSQNTSLSTMQCPMLRLPAREVKPAADNGTSCLLIRRKGTVSSTAMCNPQETADCPVPERVTA